MQRTKRFCPGVASEKGQQDMGFAALEVFGSAAQPFPAGGPQHLPENPRSQAQIQPPDMSTAIRS